MSILDFSVPSSLQVTIGDGATLLDLTPAIDSITYYHPKANPDEALIWRGEIALLEVLGFPESLDDLVNIDRWQRGKYPIRIYWLGVLKMTLRIETYEYSEDGTATIQATDVLGLMNHELPKVVGVPTGPSLFTKTTRVGKGYKSATRHGLIDSTLQGRRVAGASFGVHSEVFRPANDGNVYAPSRIGGEYTTNPVEPERNPVKAMQTLAIAAGCWVWCDKNEQIRFAPYLSEHLPVERLARSQVDELKRAFQVDDDDRSITEVTGSDQADPDSLDPDEPVDPSDPNSPKQKDFFPPGFREKYPKILNTYQKGVLVEVETIAQPSINDTNEFRQSSKLTRLDYLMPEQYRGSGGFVTSEEKEESQTFNFQGYLTLRVAIVRRCLGVLSSELYPGQAGRIVGEQVAETWTYSLLGVPKSRELEVKKPGFAVFEDEAAGQGLVFSEGETETWEPIAANQYQHTLTKFKAKGVTETGAFDASAAIDGTVISEVVEAPPEAPKKAATNPTVPVFFRETIELAPFGSTESAAKTVQRKNIRGVNSRAGAAALAMIIACLSWQRKKAHTITRPYLPIDDDYQPFQSADIKDKAFKRDGYTVAISDDSLAVSYTGNYLGLLPVTIVEDELLPPVVAPVAPFQTVGRFVDGQSNGETITAVESELLTEGQSTGETIAIVDIAAIGDEQQTGETFSVAPWTGGGGFAYSPAIVSLQGRGGLTELTSEPAAFTFIQTPDFGFDFNFYGVTRRTGFVGSASYITFGAGRTSFEGSPNRPHIQIASGLLSWRSVWVGSESPGKYRVRWEGYSGPDTEPDADSFWEVTLFDDGVIMVVVNSAYIDGGTSQVSNAAGNTTGFEPAYVNTSLVFRYTDDGEGYSYYTCDAGSYG